MLVFFLFGVAVMSGWWEKGGGGIAVEVLSFLERGKVFFS